MPSQVWPLCSYPQGDPDRFPINQPCQGKEEQTNGHGSVCLNPQPQQLLHQLCQLRGIICWWQAQPQRAGKWLFLQIIQPRSTSSVTQLYKVGGLGFCFSSYSGSAALLLSMRWRVECGVLLPTLQTGLRPWTQVMTDTEQVGSLQIAVQAL